MRIDLQFESNEVLRKPNGSKKINILYVIDYFHGTGGTERHLTHLVRRLSPDKFTCSIVVLDLAPNRWIDSIRADGVQVVHIPVGREYVPSALMRARELSKFIRSNNFDIVQTFHQKSDTYAAVVAHLSGVKHIISSKRDIGQLKKPRHFFLNRRLNKLFEKVIVVADAVGDIVVAKERMARSKIVKIYNGVDKVEFSPPTQEEKNRVRNELGLNAQDFVIGTVARFHPNKNYDIFLEGAMKAAAVIPFLKILAMGSGPLLEYFRNRYKQESAESKVIFTGDITNVAKYLKAMDVGCLVPGKNEGFSNSIIEKMAVGLPLIVTDVGGNAEAVLNHQNGIVIPPDDADAFCRALIEIYSDPVTRSEMGRRCHQLVEKKFTLRAMCENHEKLYLSLLR
ncbi:MAG: glycosyltransferase [Nitrososphaera sp.]|nr:glycosyltransferase [Nitrososphaera sp.]MCI0590556.1 glycosyltransferase [Gammaproteobacteria bacterium]